MAPLTANVKQETVIQDPKVEKSKQPKAAHATQKLEKKKKPASEVNITLKKKRFILKNFITEDWSQLSELFSRPEQSKQLMVHQYIIHQTCRLELLIHIIF